MKQSNTQMAEHLQRTNNTANNNQNESKSVNGVKIRLNFEGYMDLYSIKIIVNQNLKKVENVIGVKNSSNIENLWNGCIMFEIANQNQEQKNRNNVLGVMI